MNYEQVEPPWPSKTAKQSKSSLLLLIILVLILVLLSFILQIYRS
jgi:hypothetical protein